jgi:phosphomannomutase
MPCSRPTATVTAHCSLLAGRLTPLRTRIGSPYVIAGMATAGGDRVVGWEANGGFLTGSTVVRHGRALPALPTRDAVLPLLATLHSAREQGVGVADLLCQLPPRFAKAGLLDDVEPAVSAALNRRLTAGLDGMQEVRRHNDGRVTVATADGTQPATDAQAAVLTALDAVLAPVFTPARGYGAVCAVNVVDGLRVWFDNGEIAHIRPSGNAPQLRFYAVAAAADRAAAMVADAIAEPAGVLRQLLTETPAAPAPAQAADDALARIKANIALARTLADTGAAPEIVGTVSGSPAAQEFWQQALDTARAELGARAAISFCEDLPVNQAFGILLLWQRLREYVRDRDRGSLVAFVFGEGTRATPLTETDNAQKPALATYVTAGTGEDQRFLPMVELALRYRIPVQQYLQRSGFKGLVVQWGDEVQVPACDLSGSDPTFADADVVRFVSMRVMTDAQAAEKDWVGVNPDGEVTAFIPRRPLAQMAPLADRGLLQLRGDQLVGGINLGSIAISYAFADALLEAFAEEVNDPEADRRQRPDLDPQFFTALTIATVDEEAARAQAWQRSCEEIPAMAALAERMPDIITRLRSVISSFEAAQGRQLTLRAMDFGSVFWGDIGQHPQICDFYMALNGEDDDSEIARAIAGIDACPRDSAGNILVNSQIAPGLDIRDSVLIGARLTGSGTVRDSVLVGTAAAHIEADQAFDVGSIVRDLRLSPRGGSYKVISNEPVVVAAGERVTTLFLPTQGQQLFRVHEDADLRDRTTTYDLAIAGNPASFATAHAEMASVSAVELTARRSAAAAAVNLKE